MLLKRFFHQEIPTIRNLKENSLLSGFISPLRSLSSNKTVPDDNDVGQLPDELVELNGSNKGPTSIETVRPQTNTGSKSRAIPGPTAHTTHGDGSSSPSRGFWLH
jgi:hypothetical protein